MSNLARTETVIIGFLELEGFLLPNGKFGMSQTYLLLLAGVTDTPNYAASRYTEIVTSKQAQTLVPEGFKTHRNIKALGRHETFNIIELDSVPPFLTVCLSMGHKKSAKVLSLLSGLAIHQLFCDSFGIKFELADRQEYLKSRMAGIEKRNTWTDSIDWYIKSNPNEVSENYVKFVWSNVSDMLNVAITGKPAKYWREKLGCKQNELRNYWNDRHLNKIQHLEMYAEKSVTKKGVEPKQAMQDAINFYEFDIASESDFLRKDN